MNDKIASAPLLSRWDEFRQADRWRDDSSEGPALDTVFYTPSVVNSPGRIETEVSRSRAKLQDLAKRPLRLEAAVQLASIRQRDKQHTERAAYTCDWFTGPIPKLQPTYGQVAREYGEQESRVVDPTTLIVIDEADRLRMASLEQVRAIFDAQEIELILIGMPGLEKPSRAIRSSIPASASSMSSGRWARQRSANCLKKTGAQRV